MSGRYIGDLITTIRQRTANEDFTVDGSGDVTAGIGDDLILEFINDGKDHLQSAIISTYPEEFVVSQTIDVVANQEVYNIDDNVFINNRLAVLQYSHSGRDRDFTPLRQRPIRDRLTDTVTHPAFYIRRGKDILLEPIPQTSTAKIRAEYYRQLDRLDIRRGVVESLTGTGTSGSPLTAVTLDLTPTISSDPVPSTNLDDLLNGTFVGFSDENGSVQAYNVPVTSASSTTGVITVPSHVFGTGESISVGDYCTIGRYSTTHLTEELPDTAERFIKLYAQMRLFHKDHSQDSVEESAEMQRALNDILAVYSDPDEDVQEPPILDFDIIF